jgi:hypothetical protein
VQDERGDVPGVVLAAVVAAFERQPGDLQRLIHAGPLP